VSKVVFLLTFSSDSGAWHKSTPLEQFTFLVLAP